MNNEQSTQNETKTPPIETNQPRVDSSKKNKTARNRPSKKIVVLIVVIVLAALTVGAAYWQFFYRSADDPATVTNGASQANEAETSQQVLPLKGPAYTGAEFSANQNGNIFALTLDGEAVMERSQYDFDTYATWEDWLFFTSVDHKGKNWASHHKKRVYSVHAFNYVTHEYKTLGTMKPGDVNTDHYSFDIVDDYLYAYMGGYKQDITTYRCALNNEKACTDLSKVFYGDGEILQRGSEYFMWASIGDAGYSTSTISTFDPSSKKTTKIVSVESGLGVGKSIATIDSQGRIWLDSFSGNVSQIEKGKEDPKLIKFYAIDATGRVLKSYPQGDVPLKDIIFSGGSEGSHDEVIFYSKKQQVSFNVISGKFGKVETRDDDGSAQYTAEQVKKTITEQLQLPSGYTMLTRDCLHDKAECEFKAD